MVRALCSDVVQIQVDLHILACVTTPHLRQPYSKANATTLKYMEKYIPWIHVILE